jgi:hypothetical protein
MRNTLKSDAKKVLSKLARHYEIDWRDVEYRADRAKPIAILFLACCAWSLFVLSFIAYGMLKGTGYEPGLAIILSVFLPILSAPLLVIRLVMLVGTDLVASFGDAPNKPITSREELAELLCR